MQTPGYNDSEVKKKKSDIFFLNIKQGSFKKWKIKRGTGQGSYEKRRVKKKIEKVKKKREE